MMRLLTTTNKQSIKEAFKGNVTYQTVKAAYKQLETKMRTLCFSPEEIWMNSIIIFDKLLKHSDQTNSMVPTLWDDTFCDLRDEARDTNRDYNTEELENATSCILYVVISYMIASNDFGMVRYVETLARQIYGHSDFESIDTPLKTNIESGFCQYIKEYIKKHKFISDTFDSPQNYADPIKPPLSVKDKLEAKNGIRKRLAFMKGAMPNQDTLIMSDCDFNKMIEAVDYLIENNVVRKLGNKIDTNLSVAHLRYTFYLVYKNEGKCVDRQLWLDFLVETFSKMKNGKDSLSKHFADKPNDYYCLFRNLE